MNPVLAFLLTMGVLITIHEYGHYRVAVACGVKVLRFSFGFGKVLLRWQRHPDSTEFVISMLPFGGYVRMLDEREAPVGSHERARAFNTQALWKRAAITLAGPLANLALAVLLYSAVHWMGTEEPKALLSLPASGSVADQAGVRSGDWVRESSGDGVDWDPVMSIADLQQRLMRTAMQSGSLHLRVTDVSGRGERTVVLDTRRLENRRVDPLLLHRLGVDLLQEPVVARLLPGPAEEAGLKAGDRVLRVDEVPVVDGAHLTALIRAHTVDGVARPMDLHLQRGLQALTLRVTPAVDPATREGRVGVQVGSPLEMVTVHYGWAEGVQAALQNTWDRAAMTLHMLGRMLVGAESAKNLSGALTMADYAGRASHLGLAVFLSYLAGLSVGLGVLNLLPLPILDGGHLMYYLFEALTGRPVPGPWLERLQRGGMVILLLTMSLALFNDVTRLLGQ